MRSVVASVGLALVIGKGPCEDYFGDVSGLVTVVDVDVELDEAGHYCDVAGHSRPCTWLHYAGLKTTCLSPGPEDGCHRYIKTTYKRQDQECAGALARLNLSDCVDMDDIFSRDGVYTRGGCSDASVLSQEVHCFTGPVSDPQACECPSSTVV